MKHTTGTASKTQVLYPPGNDVERRLFTLRSSVRCYESLMEKDMDEKNVILVTDSRLMHHERSWGAMFADAVVSL